MNQERIDSLYMKAFAVIKRTFKNPEALIEWVSTRLDNAHEFSKNFKFIGRRIDYEIDIHYDLTTFLKLSTAWAENDLTKIKAGISEIYSCVGGGEEYFHFILRTLSVASWNETNYGIDDEDEFLNHFKELLKIAFIFKEVEEIQQVLSKAS